MLERFRIRSALARHDSQPHRAALLTQGFFHGRTQPTCHVPAKKPEHAKLDSALYGGRALAGYRRYADFL
jgi:hypothetical protein